MPYKHQSPEEIIAAANPAQKILWNYLFLRFGDNISISQFVFSAITLAGAELAIYNPRKIYLAYQLRFGSTSNVNAGTPTVLFYDHLNAMNFYGHNGSTCFNTGTLAPNTLPTDYEIENIVFSRISVSVYDSINFIGYRIGI